MRLACSLALGLLITVPLAASSWRPSNPWSRVRPVQEIAERLLGEGMAKSATFRRLVHRLETSDVIVYVELRPDLPRSIGGTTRFMAASITDRYLYIRLNRANNRPTLVALLGHELQHAVEVADAPAVRSPEAFLEHYRALGVRLGGGRFDSTAAQQAGYAVRAELFEARGLDSRLARARANREWALGRGGIAAVDPSPAIASREPADESTGPGDARQ